MSHAKPPEDRSGNPRTTAGDSPALVVLSGRAPRVPAKLGDIGREVWRAVWAARTTRRPTGSLLNGTASCTTAAPHYCAKWTSTV